MRTTQQPHRPLALFVILLAVFSLSLAACGDDDETVDAGSGDNASGSGADDSTDTVNPTNPAASVPTGDARPIEPNPAGATNPQPNAWDSYAVSDDGLTLTVAFYMGVDTCYSVDRVEVDETDTTVTVTIFTGSNPELEPDTACIEIAEYRSVTVTLDAPLGDRTVVDGAA